jgi:AP2 domain
MPKGIYRRGPKSHARKRVKRHPVPQSTDQSYRLIPLTQGQNAIVDAEDFQWLSQWNWFAVRSRNTWYARRRPISNGVKTTIHMHRLILGCAPHEEGEHKNGNGLDNRRENLRRATRSQNMQNVRRRSDNSSGYRGVSWDSKHNRWSAFIAAHNVHTLLGRFLAAEEAARAYDEAAQKLHGQFARLNFPA